MYTSFTRFLLAGTFFCLTLVPGAPTPGVSADRITPPVASVWAGYTQAQLDQRAELPVSPETDFQVLEPAQTPQTPPSQDETLAVEIDQSIPLDRFNPQGSVILRFNQPMDPGSATPALLPFPYVAGKITWDETSTLLTFTPEKSLLPGQTYLFYLDPNLESRSGETFSQVPSWKIQVLDAPQVVERSPGMENVRHRRPEIRLRFDREMDPASIIRSLTVQPVVSLQPECEGDTCILRLEQPFEPGARYTFTLSGGATDVQGVPLGEDYRWQYWLEPLRITINNGDDYASNRKSVEFSFNYDLDPARTGLPFTLEPAVAGQWKWVGENRLDFTASQALPLEYLYTLRITGPLWDPQGEQVPPPVDLVRFGAEQPVRYAGSNETTTIGSTTPIEIIFNQPMNHAGVERAFKVSPAMQGLFQWQNNRLFFIPDVAWSPFTEYTFTIGVDAVNAAGQAVLVKPYIWTVYTGYTSSQLASFGSYGANVQVVDADGRRAIQFALNTQGPSNVVMDLYQFELGEFAGLYAMYFGIRYYQQSASFDLSQVDPYQTWQTTYNSGGVQELLVPENVPAGLYVINLSVGSKLCDQLFLAITRNTIVVKRSGEELLVWVSDINGASLADSEVRLYSDRGEKIRVGNTDSEGIFRTTIPTGYEPMLVAARGEGADVSIAGIGSGWYSAGNPWYWGMGWGNPDDASPRRALVYLYTDRPIYRPGQTVHFKAILRLDHDVKYSLPPDGAAVTLRVRDARQNIVQTYELEANSFGSMYGEFPLAAGAMVGDYSLEAVFEGDTHTQKFQVQDYRKPDFKVSVIAGAEQYVVGDQVDVKVAVDTFFGKPVPNARLTIKKYHLTEIYTGWWEEAGEGQVEYLWYDIAETHTQTTDAQGQAEVSLKTAAFSDYESRSDWHSSLAHSTWGIEVTADDGSGQLVSGTAIYKVYNAAEMISMDIGGYFKRPGEAFTIQASAQSLDSEPVANRQLAVELRRWDRRNWDYTQVVTSTKLTTRQDGLASLPFTPADPGYYQLRLSGKDPRGNLMSYNRWIYVYRENETWANDQAQEIKLSAEKDTYKPYGKARLIVESSFSGPALLTFERGRVNRVKPVTLTAPITFVEVEIIPEDAPNIFVTINAWQPQDTRLIDRDEGDYSTNLPDSRLRTSTVELRVESLAKALKVAITSDRQVYSPRQAATFTITVTDQEDQPVFAEVSLALVDESIYSLSGELSRDIFEAFYGRREHRVWTFDSLAPIREIIEYGRGGGGGDGNLQASPRSDFPDTAAWFPALETDERGQVKVTLSLPDSLTSWRLTARAITQSTQVAQAYTNIVTQQEIVVRPILPRSLTAGDQFEISAIVTNYAEESRQVVLHIDAGRLALSVPPTHTIQLQPGEMQLVGWPVRADQPGEDQVTVSATTPTGGGDAVRLPLSIRPLAIPDVYTQIGDFSRDWSTLFVFPESALESSSIQVQLSRSPAGSALYGLAYLTGYPYGCVEQTMSRALPNAVIGRLFARLGIQDPALQAELPGIINAGLQRLYGYQHDDGGWGWWYDDLSHDYQTAWVVFGLTVTAEAGYQVDPQVIQRGAQWLAGKLPEMDIRTRAYALYSLAVAGQGDLEATRQLVERIYELDPFSQAALAQALELLGARDEAMAVLEVLAGSALVERQQEQVLLAYWPSTSEDGHYYEKTMASSTRNTAMALAAFLRTAPDHPLIPGMVRYLMNERRADGWGSTNETAYTILALTDHLLAASATTPETDFQVELNDQVILTGTLSLQQLSAELDIPAAQMQRGLNRLRIRQAGEGLLYFVINSRMLLPEAQIGAGGAVEVTRAYLDAKTGKRLEALAAGQLVEVKLTVKLPRDGAFIIVEDQLPGGLEALNERLNTTSHDAAAFDYEYGGPRLFWEKYGYNQKEVYGDRVSFFITDLSAGAHTFTYLARASRTGTFTALPAEVYAMYDATLWGRSASLVAAVAHEVVEAPAAPVYLAPAEADTQ